MADLSGDGVDRKTPKANDKAKGEPSHVTATTAAEEVGRR